jgi:hypothetical protein
MPASDICNKVSKRAGRRKSCAAIINETDRYKQEEAALTTYAIWTFYIGPRDRARTCGLMVPNSPPNFFLLIYSDIPSFLLGFAYSLTLFETLFSRVPGLSVVIYVVKNASRPRPAACRRAPNGKRFFVSDRLDCNSERWVIQEVSDRVGDADFEGQ